MAGCRAWRKQSHQPLGQRHIADGERDYDWIGIGLDVSKVRAICGFMRTLPACSAARLSGDIFVLSGRSPFHGFG